MEHHHHEENCPSCAKKQTKWYKEKFYIFSIILIITLIASYLITTLNPLFDNILGYIKLIWWAVLLGLLIGGLIDRFIPKEYVSKYLASHKKRTIFSAVVLGFLMSACSHGILAISMELYKKGASTSAVIAFLLASPWANLTITILLFSFFGTKALLIVIAAIIIAIITGLIYQILEKKNLVEKNTNTITTEKDFSILKDIKKRFRDYKFNFKKDISGTARGIWSLNMMVTWWIIIGMLMASLAKTYVPTHFFHQFLGPSLLGLIITLVIATIIEVCSEGSSPIAFEIYQQTGALGNSMVFLMAGVVTDYTEIGLVWSNIGRKAAIWLPIITVPQVLLIGYLLNIFL